MTDARTIMTTKAEQNKAPSDIAKSTLVNCLRPMDNCWRELKNCDKF